MLKEKSALSRSLTLIPLQYVLDLFLQMCRPLIWRQHAETRQFFSFRRPGDGGGHYIAARFNGPRDGFNHFAQQACSNRGSYRALEDRWARELRAAHKVFVDNVPHHAGTSQRSDSIAVTGYVDGRKAQKNFPNEAPGKSDVR